MRVVLKALVGLALGAGVMVSTPFAAGDMFMQDLIEVRVEMGNFYFKPKHIELETGQYYKLV
ncbi:MAG: hypothetical protein GWO39_02520, partial [Gammaproteobacteria bacterium]|nr:hypothetical protein [Gammaproteobacteria bacterium]NIT62699.1 hypothetical protein [Gammaproteobacteria bacterium]NIY31279.1 hypothetical protein [Gammaproteobacteria bacterium]